MKRKPTTPPPAFSQEAIRAAIATAPEDEEYDSENPPLTADFWKNAIVSHSWPELKEKLEARRRGPGKAPLKVPTTIRFDPDVLAALKATGKGWQTRVNDAMREWVKTHPA